MAFSAGAPGRRNEASMRPTGVTGFDSDDWDQPEKESRDWKKIVLVIGLGTLSWAATYVGMLELIQSNLGDLPLSNKIIIGFSVAMLMTMIIWLLDQIFSPTHIGTKFFFVLGYIFLTLISVGFGFGFYWKVLESRAESTRSAESAIGQVQNSLHAGLTRLEQLTKTLVQLEQISTAKAVEEREKGTSCPNSRPGDGPRRKLRDADAQSFGFASQFVTSRLAEVRTELTTLDTDLQKVVKREKSTVDAKTGTRNDFLRDLNRRLDITVTGFNTFRTDPQLRQIRSDLNDRAGKTVFPTTNGGTFSCPDSQLQGALRGVVRAIDQLPDLEKPKIAAVEGSEATIEAFRRLTASVVGIVTLTPPLTSDELRARQQKAVQSVENTGALRRASYEQPTGLGKRDYIPLAIAIFVDLCLLLVSIGRPMNRLNGLIPKMREAEKGPVIRILSRFNEIHRDPEIRQNFEVFRHVVFDYLGDYYVAVPLDTPYNRGGPKPSAYYGAADAQDLQHEAHLLANLFASFEKEKIFKRVFFMPMRTVRARLRRQGSKFTGTTAFRVYRFKEGAWSDIILGAVMGAAKRVEAEKARRQALEDELLDDLKSRNSHHANAEPTLGGVTKPGPLATGEARSSGKVPPFVLRHTPEGPVAYANGNNFSGETADVAAMSANGKNGHNGHNGHSTPTRSTIVIEEDFDDDELAELTAEDEQQIRSRYGKYADKILAEHTQSAARKGNNGALHDPTQPSHAESADSSADGHDLKTTAANSNTIPTKSKVQNSRETDSSTQQNGPEVPTVIKLPQAASSRVAIDAQTAESRDNAPPEEESTGHTSESFYAAFSSDGPTTGETTVKLTRETATYTVPVSEAVMPAALRQAARGATSVITTQTAIETKPAELEVIPTEYVEATTMIENAHDEKISTHHDSNAIETDDDFEAIGIRNDEPATAPMSLTPPPLPNFTNGSDNTNHVARAPTRPDDVVIAVANRFKPDIME